MMTRILTVLLLLVSVAAGAQKLTYFDADWKICAKEKAQFFRKTTVNANQTATVEDYWIDGSIQMKGLYKSAAVQFRDGKFQYYFKSGKLSSEGMFVNDERSGKWIWYHENGQTAETGVYDKRGMKTGKWKLWHANGKVDSEGEFKKDKRNGVWNFFFDNGVKSAVETYKDGAMLSASYYNQLGVECNDNRCGVANPMFKGGDEKFFQYVKDNLKYPAGAVSRSTGQVWVRFMVSADGSIKDVKIIQSVSPALDEEAKKLVATMPDWMPGKKHNRAVDVYIELPFNFTE